MLSIGYVLPELTLTDEDGLEYKLDTEKEYLIVYFYSVEDTKACTNVLKRFNDELGQLEELNTEIIAITLEDAKKIKKLKRSDSLNIKLLSDSIYAASSAFGVINAKTQSGKQLMSLNRIAFLFNMKDKRKLIKIFKDIGEEEYVNNIVEQLKNLLSR